MEQVDPQGQAAGAPVLTAVEAQQK